MFSDVLSLLTPYGHNFPLLEKHHGFKSLEELSQTKIDGKYIEKPTHQD